ncbi:beta-1,4-galactosyltransferase 7 [Scaptodrosophila lebanonensis]|uniref:Beta-1,4-N-acetylgalactosaminyltransferase n=1 Tax=Drosophila lebanonensis TaxID=7225 RepID=A0A6J2T5T3_DROLE|nr:beta-1,4-galactosyltransferase 7 [Scaptodrosophila lebanonensis]
MASISTMNWLFVCGVSFCLGGIAVLSLMPLSSDCICPLSNPLSRFSSAASAASTYTPVKHESKRPHKLALLVPFRDRFEELLQFVPHMTKFLKRQDVVHHIFVINQVDRYRFNRASLINVGFHFAGDVYDYIAMHDVDLLPLNDALLYEYPSNLGPLHIAGPKLHPKYHYDKFVGGILLVRSEHFKLMNGMSNQYWGWGLEDDEFYVRIRDAGLQVTRPQNIKTGVNDTFSHIHNRHHRKRDTTKCFNQKEVTRKRDHNTGLSNVDYKILKVHELTIDGVGITVLNVLLECDVNKTPWCDCNGSAAAASAVQTK